jgi:hypothetical protein
LQSLLQTGRVYPIFLDGDIPHRFKLYS